MAQVTVFVNYNGNGTTNHKLSLTDSQNHVGGSNPGDPSGSHNQDNITTNIEAGDTITWQPQGTVVDVVSITPKDSHVDFLNTPTHNADGSVSATVKSGFAGGQMESYNINYKIKDDNTVYTDDPKMQMNPPS